MQKLDEAVKEAKKNREWRHEYMTLLMRDQENIAKGEEKGEEKMLILIQKLIADKHIEDITKMQENKSYRQELYKKYYID